MKKIHTLLFLFPFLFTAQSLSFTSSNEANIGDLVNLYLCDSNANNYSSIVGNNVTWDYSQLAGVFGVTKDVEILDASLSSNFTSFAGSAKILSVGGTLETFYTGGTGRTSQGFVFNEVSLGAVVASWNIDQQNLMTYPFALGNMVTDNFSGSITSVATGTVPSSGTSVSIYDGVGTLLLPGGNTYTNVSRYHLKDSAVATFSGMPASFVRNVYEYYDLSTSDLPIFMLVNVNLITTFFINSSTLVLSKNAPTTFVGIDEQTSKSFTIHPNPVVDEVHLTGLFDKNEGYNVTDLSGRTFLTGLADEKINVSTLPSGSYFIRIGATTMKFIKL
jgi:hypothetical protein